MKKIFLILNISIIVLKSYCQVLPEDNFFDSFYFNSDIHSPTYKELFQAVKKHNIQTIIIWDSKDSLGANKQKYCQFEYDKKHRLINEFYFEDNKIVPFEKYRYIGSKKIIKTYYFEDSMYWIKYEMNLNKIGLIETIDINSEKCYDIKINYNYNDSLIVKKEIIDNSCELNLGWEGEGTTIYYYDSLKRIVKIENTLTKEIKQFKYNNDGFLYKFTRNHGNPEWENTIINYLYTDNKLAKKVSESFGSGKKNDIKIIETYYEYNSKGLLEKELIKDLKNNKTSIRAYKYNNDGILILTAWIHPNSIMENNYNFYSYEFY